ncbi:MAG: hypothetical protein A2046_11645 [Bacteroidetes bacterium GWA2_30_7]|nr:MAG: hypothetical protein A2046_11645 [Bacteroidetes bacterium GWA2_30_7]
MKIKLLFNTSENKPRQIIKHFTLSGFAIGLLCPILATIIEFNNKNLAFSLSNIMYVHQINPIIFIIDLAPVVIAFAAYLVGSNYVRLNLTLENEKARLNNVFNFTEKLSEDNFAIDYKLEDDKDVLGKALINLRDKLKNNLLAENKRKEEDNQRNWVSLGLAKFADLLRNDNDNLENLAYNVLSNLINYLNANQGGIFILNNSDKHEKYFDLVAMSAYNRKKYTEKKFDYNEGLIGRCALEKETIYLTDIPENYIEIKSGLGTANPRCLLIVPLKLNDIIFGIIEIASFTKLESYQIEFVEKIGESIASTISNVKINEHTKNLLAVAQQKTEELLQSEEEMRQNLEEMHATQDEMERKDAELSAINDELKKMHKELDQKDIDQKKEIERLNALNEKRVQELEKNNKEMQETINEFQNFCNEEAILKKQHENKCKEEKTKFQLEIENKYNAKIEKLQQELEQEKQKNKS